MLPVAILPAIVGAFLLSYRAGAGVGVLVSAGLLIAIPILVVGQFFNVTRHVSPALRQAWGVLTAGAIAALAAQLHTLLGHLLPESALTDPALVLLLLLVALLLFVGGGALLARSGCTNPLPVRTALDAALILALLAALMTGISASLNRATGAPPGISGFDLLLACQVGSVALLFYVLGMAICNGHGISLSVAAALAAGAALFAGGSVTTAAILNGLLAGGTGHNLIWLGAWCCLGFAALRAGRDQQAVNLPPPLAASASAPTWPAWSLPAAGGFVLVVLVLDRIGNGGSAAPGTHEVGALIALGVVLAARIGYGLRTGEQQAERARQVARDRAICQLGQDLSVASGLDSRLELVTRQATTLLETRKTVVELLSDDGTALVVRAGSGIDLDLIGTSTPKAAALSGRVVEQRVPWTWTSAENAGLPLPDWLENHSRHALAVTPLSFGDKALGAIICLRPEPFNEPDLELLDKLAGQAAIGIENSRLFQRVLSLSLTDPLTGVANRRQLNKDMAREFAAARRGRSVLFALFDLDGFKDYNDRYGHLAGDEVLKLFGGILRTESRIMNPAARFGGDEFAALLTDSDMEGGRIFIARIRERFAEESEALTGIRLSVSVGLAEFHPDMQRPEDLIAVADKLLYEDKGRLSNT